MFPLIESKRSRTYRGVLGGGLLSVTAHSIAVAGAVYATLHAGLAREVGRFTTSPLVVPAAPPPRPPVGERWPVLPPLGPQILVVSPTIPPEIPAPSPNRPFDPSAFYLPGDTGGVPWGQPRDTGRVVRPDGVYMADVVEERPERVGGPPPHFPEIMRQAGIGGRVMVECVVDTTGRVESGSLRIVSSTNPLFDAPAREAVAASLFRPGRLGARAVRVRVQVPLNFEISRFQ